MTRSAVRSFITISLFFLVAAAPAVVFATSADGHSDEHAAAGEAGTHSKKLVVNWVDWSKKDEGKPPFGGALINFGIFLFILIYFGGKPIQAFLRERHSTIKRSLEEGRRLRQEAQQKLEEYQKRIDGMEREIDELVSKIRQQAEQEKQRILDQAEAQAAALKRDAEDRIGAEVERARRALEREVVDAAVAAAEQILKLQARPDDQHRLVESFLTSMEREGAQPEQAQ